MGGMILMNVLNVQPKVKTKEAFTMENKKDKITHSFVEKVIQK